MLMLIGGGSAALLLTMSLLPTMMAQWKMALLAVGLGMLLSGWHAVYSVLLPELSGPALASSAVGLGYGIVEIGSLMAPPLFGYIVDVTGGYRWAWSFVALVVAIATPLLLRVREEPLE